MDLPPLSCAVRAVNHMSQDSSSICSDQTSHQATAVAARASRRCCGVAVVCVCSLGRVGGQQLQRYRLVNA